MGITIGFPTSNPWAVPAHVEQMIEADVDYIAGDFQSEMSLTQRILERERDGDRGYVESAVTAYKDVIDDILENNIQIVANAGALNPKGLARRFLEEIDRQDITIAAVTGDNLLEKIPDFREQNITFDNLDTGEKFNKFDRKILAAQVYTGAFPAAEALNRGADIVFTGRSVDPAAAMAPMIHEFGWQRDDLYELATGLTAGQLSECSNQITGRNYMYGWEDVDYASYSYEEMGQPIIEIEEAGEFVLTKPEGTGGVITDRSVKEHLVYEIKDPNYFKSPDVTADLTAPTIEQADENRIRVSGTDHNGRPEDLKMQLYYQDGYKGQTVKVFTWPDAIKKAEAAKEVLMNRAPIDQLEEVQTDVIGWNACHAGIHPKPEDPPEVALRFAAKAEDEGFLNSVLKMRFHEGIPGSRSLWRWGPPRITENLGIWPTLISQEWIDMEITLFSVESGA